jgi:hypothetical protein
MPFASPSGRRNGPEVRFEYIVASDLAEPRFWIVSEFPTFGELSRRGSSLKCRVRPCLRVVCVYEIAFYFCLIVIV